MTPWRPILFLWMIFLLFQEGGASALAPWVGPNVRLGEDPQALPSGDGRNQAEPHVTRSAVDPDLLLATFQEGRYSDGGAVCNGYAVSGDGGFTWERALNPKLTFASGGIYHRATDPVAGISRNGILYLNSLVAMDASFNRGRLVIQRSYDAGESWSDPINIYTGYYLSQNNRIFPDKNWMAVNDLEGSPHEGRIVVTWTNFRTQKEWPYNIEDYLIMASHSDDEGSTWSEAVFVTPPSNPQESNLQYQGSQPVFLPGGGLAIVYHNFLGTHLEVRYSPDGGESFPFGPAMVHDGYILYDAPNLRDGSFLPSVGVARETGDIYIAYTSRPAYNDLYGRIHFVRSRRPQPTRPVEQSPDWRFTEPLVVSGPFTQDVTCTPTLSVSPDGHRVTIHYYDNRNGTGENDSGDFYAVQSTDGGSTWSQPFRISESTFPLSRATWTSRGYMLGDYYGFAPPMGPDQAAVAVWVGTPLATADPWSARIGGLDSGRFGSWLQAQLPYAMRQGNPEADRYSDPDRDGAPNIVEYVLGRSPRSKDPRPDPDTALTHYLIRPATDPENAATISAETGTWPGVSVPLADQPVIRSHGEGYWDELSWNATALDRHFRLTIGAAETWFFLGRKSPSSWVLQLDGDWVGSPWMGEFNTREDPWLYHAQLGWLYNLEGLLFSPGMDAWLFPSPEYHPWIYRSDGHFIYLYGQDRLYYDTALQDWRKAG